MKTQLEEVTFLGSCGMAEARHILLSAIVCPVAEIPILMHDQRPVTEGKRQTTYPMAIA
jgi:hypothetical protein